MVYKDAVLWRLMFVVVAIGIAAPAASQPPGVQSFDVLAGVNAVLHVADMVGTGYTLTHPAPTFRARESSPYLRPLESRPAALAAASGALCVVEVWALEKIRRRHPKVATVAMAGLVAVKLIGVTNNVRITGQLQAARTGWRPPL